MENPFGPLRNEIKKIIAEVFEEKMKEFLLKLNTSKPSPEILTIKEAAAYLKMSVHTLYQYTSSRLIPFSKPRGKIRFTITELDQWIKDNRHKTRGELGLGE